MAAHRGARGPLLTSKTQAWLLLTLNVFVWPTVLGHDNSLVRNCDFAESRSARAILKKHIYDAAAKLDYVLPPACPINPENDILRLFEDNKKEIRRRKWECRICGKQFEAEAFLDKHFINRHLDTHVPQNATRCFASLCDILRCDSENWKPPGAEKRCNKQKLLHRKHYCNMVIHKCFPSEHSEEIHHLNMELTHHFCVPLSCDPADYRHITDAPSKTSHVGFILSCVLLSVFVVVYYLCMYFNYGLPALTGNSRSDLVRRPDAANGIFSQMFRGAFGKTKTKYV